MKKLRYLLAIVALAALAVSGGMIAASAIPRPSFTVTASGKISCNSSAVLEGSGSAVGITSAQLSAATFSVATVAMGNNFVVATKVVSGLNFTWSATTPGPQNAPTVVNYRMLVGSETFGLDFILQPASGCTPPTTVPPPTTTAPPTPPPTTPAPPSAPAPAPQPAPVRVVAKTL